MRLNRMTAVTMLGELNLSLQNAAKLPYLYDCFGIVQSIKSGDDGKGPWVQFRGKFQAVTADDHCWHSKRCHVPVNVQALLENEWLDLEAHDPEAQLAMAVRVRVMPLEGVQSGFWFSGDQLIRPRRFNELGAWREQVRAALD